MAKKKIIINDGYQPTKKPKHPASDPNPQSGYVPTTNQDKPKTKPKPPGNE